ncbi:Metallo-dependent phosphatase-like protein [Zychaea mexicana]|uniref:Metallo-dependent phosphatase-like protein n=1 Tax=Zychaea mexicana TaxID=64656 RepID=UPI0022FE8DE0|nr:Metallo-dependent phosphatase-like protein [Zychaea mexicana]KAI9494399.1 Metallo-dependent phosphatase-like protein [Zychaea mexicana]
MPTSSSSSRTLPNNLHGKFLHITDIHIDPHYQDEATIKSGCHRQAKKHHNKKKRKGKLAGYWGSPTSGCDAPPRLANHVIDWIADGWKEEIDFIVWTGDNARTIPIIPCIGNNDVHPHNQLQETVNILETYSEMWRDFIPADQLPTFRQGGYYAIDVAPGLRVLVLNTLYFYDSNDAVKGCEKRKGPGHDHLEWIRAQLATARRDRARVYMIGHVPPSERTFYSSCLDLYTDVSLEYRDIIGGHMYGHVNMDHFTVLQKENNNNYDCDPTDDDDDDDVQVDLTMLKKSDLRKQYKKVRENEPAVVIHVAPPILPVYNPGFRINEYNTDPSSADFGVWIKYTQYYSDLNEYNNKHRPELEPPQFQIEYATDEEPYNMKDLSAESWVDLAKRMTQKGSKKSKHLWKTFKKNMFVQT